MYMVASWACDVTEILTRRSTEEASYCVKITVISQAELANQIQDIHIPYLT